MKRYYAEGVRSRHAAEHPLRNRHPWKPLRGKKVLVAGAGGLGSFVLAGLVGSGVGEIHVVDRDRVEVHNLNRQFFYALDDIGKEKVRVVEERLSGRPTRVRGIEGDALDVDLSSYDLVFDCLDRWEAKTKLLRRSLEAKVPLVFMSVGEGVGMVSVPTKPLPISPRESRVVSTPEIMVTAGIGVEEGLRILLGEEPRLKDKVLVVDLRSLDFVLLDI